MDLFRRALGALPDAAWLRRQFTADAEIVQDVRYGARALRQAPTFAASAILILALGIGGTVTIVTLLDTLLVRSLPYRDAERIVTVWQRSRIAEKDDVAPGNFLAVGLAGALVATRFLEALLFEIRPGDPLTLVSVSALLSTVGLAACYLPARRATRIDPLVALRTE